MTSVSIHEYESSPVLHAEKGMCTALETGPQGPSHSTLSGPWRPARVMCWHKYSQFTPTCTTPRAARAAMMRASRASRAARARPSLKARASTPGRATAPRARGPAGASPGTLLPPSTSSKGSSRKVAPPARDAAPGNGPSGADPGAAGGNKSGRAPGE